jgi:hypothetical protein
VSGETITKSPEVGPQVSGQERNGGEVVNGAVEKPLDLARVEVDRHYPFGARGHEEISDHPRCYWLAAPRLAVLAGVPITGANRCDPLGGRSLGSVNHDPLLHQQVVDGTAATGVMRLQYENVGATYRLAETGTNFPVREVNKLARANFDPEVPSDVGSQLRV